MRWIDTNKILENENVKLIPLKEEHFEILEQIAQHQSIWEHYVVDMCTKQLRETFFKNALNEKEKGNQQPFVIIDKTTNTIIGSTRLMDVVEKHKKLEIGSTWLHPNYWGTTINLDCKLLLLTYCFEVLKTNRVLLKTDERNIRSQKAIKKTGAKFEGVLRNELIRYNGTLRNSVYFSIIAKEWNEAKMLLLANLYQKQTHHVIHNSNKYTWGNNCQSWVLKETEMLSVKEECMPFGTSEKLHFHKHATQFFYVLKGCATFYVEQQKTKVNQQEGIIIHPNQKHLVENVEVDDLEFLVISQPSTINDRINV